MINVKLWRSYPIPSNATKKLQIPNEFKLSNPAASSPPHFVTFPVNKEKEEKKKSNTFIFLFFFCLNV